MTDEITCPDCLITFFSGQELGGHAKTHKRNRTDKPACFTDANEWEYTLTQLRIENPRKMITSSFALAEACAVCPLEFMQQMESRGRCHPPEGAIPQRDLNVDIEALP